MNNINEIRKKLNISISPVTIQKIDQHFLKKYNQGNQIAIDIVDVCRKNNIKVCVLDAKKIKKLTQRKDALGFIYTEGPYTIFVCSNSIMGFEKLSSVDKQVALFYRQRFIIAYEMVLYIMKKNIEAIHIIRFDDLYKNVDSNIHLTADLLIPFETLTAVLKLTKSRFPIHVLSDMFRVPMFLMVCMKEKYNLHLY